MKPCGVYIVSTTNDYKKVVAVMERLDPARLDENWHVWR